MNPVNGKEIPIFISDYVLISYGTGAILSLIHICCRTFEAHASAGPLRARIEAT